MSYVRAWVVENSVSWSAGMKVFRKSGEPGLKAARKGNILQKYTLVQAGERTGLLILEFDTKANMNKLIKAMNAARQEVAEGAGQQSWVYTGPVKASG